MYCVSCSSELVKNKTQDPSLNFNEQQLHCAVCNANYFVIINSEKDALIHFNSKTREEFEFDVNKSLLEG